MYGHGLSQGLTKSAHFRWGGKKGGRAWTRWPSEVPFSPRCCMIVWMNGFLMWVLPLGERAGREYFPCKGRSDTCSSFTYLLSPFQWALTAVWFYTSEYWPHKQQEEVKNLNLKSQKNLHCVWFIRADPHLVLYVKVFVFYLFIYLGLYWNSYFIA